ncbi:TatD family deoxyribonuclease [Panacibacter ginsenosidivorans]|uniref:TatD family deoxyribonuclease n=1 Tax=Panacibacter ginsenosidivorans TaxID=1813871 RepID=A0A5B8VAA9_9BACT|nr:TatD family hydrolase [Panacibacter ginsenosidivorans]QEC68407.1 TatD family deoxyribonuclease [Panacibacter ginsenosidivorans]
MKFIDTHCHLYLEDFKSDINDIIEKAKKNGVEKFFLPAIDSSIIEAMLTMETKFPGACFAMMGLHPCSVKANYKEELKIAEDWLIKRKFAAIGEIGLDFYWDKTFTPEQYAAFEIQMQWALEKSMPIVIHTRNAMQETIDTVKPFAEKGLRGIFHCFSGTYENVKAIIDMGFLVGIGGVLTYKNAGLQQVIEKIGLAHIVLETDAPYLTPVPYRGKRNESSYIVFIAEKLAEIKKVTIEEVAAITTANAEKIFGC